MDNDPTVTHSNTLHQTAKYHATHKHNQTAINILAVCAVKTRSPPSLCWHSGTRNWGFICRWQRCRRQRIRHGPSVGSSSQEPAWVCGSCHTPLPVQTQTDNSSHKVKSRDQSNSSPKKSTCPQSLHSVTPIGNRTRDCWITNPTCNRFGHHIRYVWERFVRF